MLSRSIVVWIALACLVIVSVMAFSGMSKAPGAELASGAVALHWVFLVVSLALLGRAHLAWHESSLLIRGRLRRRTIDARTIVRFEGSPYAFGTWTAMMLPRWLGTMHFVKVVYTDGSEMGIGCDLDCVNLSHRLHRHLHALRSTTTAG